MKRPVIRINPNDSTRSIPAILTQARGELKLWNIEFDHMGIWGEIVRNNLSYNEAINLILKYTDIEIRKYNSRRRNRH